MFSWKGGDLVSPPPPPPPPEAAAADGAADLVLGVEPLQVGEGDVLLLAPPPLADPLQARLRRRPARRRSGRARLAREITARRCAPSEMRHDTTQRQSAGLRLRSAAGDAARPADLPKAETAAGRVGLESCGRHIRSRTSSHGRRPCRDARLGQAAQRHTSFPSHPSLQAFL